MIRLMFDVLHDPTYIVLDYVIPRAFTYQLMVHIINSIYSSLPKAQQTERWAGMNRLQVMGHPRVSLGRTFSVPKAETTSACRGLVSSVGASITINIVIPHIPDDIDMGNSLCFCVSVRLHGRCISRSFAQTVHGSRLRCRTLGFKVSS